MLPFYPKLGAAEDAPNYRPAESEDRCETCAHYRDLGQQGYCEKFSFSCSPDFVCDDYVPSGTVKESQVTEALRAELDTRKRALEGSLSSLSRGEIKNALLYSQQLLSEKPKKAILAAKMIYPTTKTDD